MAEHLADLHARAAELGIPRYRMLPREELIAKIETAGRRRPGLLGRLFGGKPKEAGKQKVEKSEKAEAADGPQVKGTLQVMPRRFGFMRVEGRDDVYVSASQIRRCKLRAGDVVEGPIREPREGEGHHALARVIRVNGRDV
jgi:transcription termination factor Rho